MRVAIYARVSTKRRKDKDGAEYGQDPDNQVDQLKAYLLRQPDWTLVRTFVDVASGSTGDRDQFKSMMACAHRRDFDLILFWALDRFTREGVLDTLTYLNQLSSWGIHWKSYTEQYLDSTGMFKDAVISILATIAKQENLRRKERINAGMDRARAKGVHLGRPGHVFDTKILIRLSAEGNSMRDIVRIVDRTYGVKLSSSTVMNRLRRAKDEVEALKKTIVVEPAKFTQLPPWMVRAPKDTKSDMKRFKQSRREVEEV